ncbi:MAG: hypothetical protein AAFR58_26405 [Cyanobacteria bacterium J06627_28]
MTVRKRSWPLLPLTLTLGVGLQVLTLFLLLGQSLAIHRLQNKKPPTLVQTTEGSAFRVSPIPGDDRSPEAIQGFVSTLLPQMFNWNAEIVTNNGETIRDPGIVLDSESSSGGNKRVTTASATASMALSPDFRLQFLEHVAEVTPAGVFSGQSQVVMIVEQVSKPMELETGKWKVNVLAHLNVFGTNNAPKEIISFNREVVVEATTAPLMPEGETPLEQAVYTIRQAGLQITDIRPIAR